MKKEELTAFIENIKKWQDGADVPVPQPKDLRVAYDAMLKIAEVVDELTATEKLKELEFRYFVNPKTEKHKQK